MRVSRGANKNFFAIKLFNFCDLKTEQRFLLQVELNISIKELTSLIDSLCDFLITFDQASKCILIPLPKLKVEIGHINSKDNLFAHCYNGIIEHLDRQIRLSFRFRNNNSCRFSIKMFELHGNHFMITEVVNLNHCEIRHLCKNRSYVANKCEVIESIYDV